jgi:hypothetical protein
MGSKPPKTDTAPEASVEIPPIQWRDVPTVAIDAALGNATVGGTHRVTLGEFVFNETPGATQPKLRSVVTLALTAASLKHLADYLTKLANPTDG